MPECRYCEHMKTDYNEDGSTSHFCKHPDAHWNSKNYKYGEYIGDGTKYDPNPQIKTCKRWCPLRGKNHE